MTLIIQTIIGSEAGLESYVFFRNFYNILSLWFWLFHVAKYVLILHPLRLE